MLKISITLLFFLITSFPVLSAPRVPAELTDNGLIYCTHATGFSFNPQTADAGTSMNVVTEQIYNKLFEIKANSSQVVPSLAQSYKISPDGKTITLYLRRGVKFHHTPWFTPSRDFNADDVVFSLNRVLGHNTSLPEFELEKEQNIANRQYSIFHDLAKKTRFPYFESIKLNQKINYVENVDPYTVQIHLFEPDASILSHLASQYAVIFSHEYALQLNADDNLEQLDTLPVGTGAYQLQEYLRGQYVRLMPNPYYWQKPAKISNIIIDLSTDKTGRMAKFFNNECHIAAFPEVSQLGLLQQSGAQFKTTITEGMNLSFLAFNFLRPAMQNADLRRAIALAINRERLIKHIYYDTAVVANNIIPAISWAAGNDASHFDYDYDPKKAREILANMQVPPLEMWSVQEEQLFNPAPIKMAEMIRADLKAVGLDVKVRLISRNFLTENLHNKTEDYDLILAGWLAGSLDPDSFLRPILSCGTTNEISNVSNWCSESFDQLLDSALTHSDPHARAADYAIAQRQVFSELPILPLANVKRILISNTRVNGIEVTPFGNIHFEKLSLKKERK
ncbi:ABC transporter substrate-binding protein [Bisgaard Taxon 10/6]|uniref:ABC transporter substrate-binding protein n=1 Tax=Exercitatus varius TaxID=67857 RepID=UPI00294AE679|nr:ABC transporter substrate-binding protein [Exercitatus varius]MDG2954667.1 ABC transporter substrate-binding protein [Exercitatus varius]